MKIVTQLTLFENQELGDLEKISMPQLKKNITAIVVILWLIRPMNYLWLGE